VCSQAIAAGSTDPRVRFWRAFALTQEGFLFVPVHPLLLGLLLCFALLCLLCRRMALRCGAVRCGALRCVDMEKLGNHGDAIRELEPLQERADIALAVCAALITVYKGVSTKGISRLLCQAYTMLCYPMLASPQTAAHHSPSIPSCFLHLLSCRQGLVEQAQGKVEKSVQSGCSRACIAMRWFMSLLTQFVMWWWCRVTTIPCCSRLVILLTRTNVNKQSNVLRR
jgi:hypothetical protein